MRLLERPRQYQKVINTGLPINHREKGIQEIIRSVIEAICGK
jgi:hypothetical protein